MKRGPTTAAAFRTVPIWATRVENTPERAASVKAIYQREGCYVRVQERTIEAGGAVIRFWVIVARRPAAPKARSGEHAEPKS
jgi:hypothetical protein